MLACLLSSIQFTSGAQEKTNCVLMNGECQPLLWYVNQTQTLSGTELIFLEGDHILMDNVSMIFTNVSDLKIIGNGTVRIDLTDRTPLPTSRVICKANAGFVFLNSHFILIEGLTFVNCGVRTNITFGDSPIQAAVTFYTCYNIAMTQILITDSIGYGLAVKNTHGEFHVSGSAFVKSKLPVTSKLTGNARFWFEDCQPNCTLDSVTVLIENSWFLYGNGGPLNDSISDGTGLSLLIYCPLVNVQLKNITAKNNTSAHGGNIIISMLSFAFENTSTVYVENSFIKHGYAKAGGGILIGINNDSNNHNTEKCAPQNNDRVKTIVSINNTLLEGNSANMSGGAVRITHHEQLGTSCTNLLVYFYNCTFVRNSAKTGAAVRITKHGVLFYKLHSVPQVTVTFEMCNIARNHIRVCSEQANEDGILDFLSMKKTVIKNTNFTENNGTALFIVNSGVIFEEHTLFRGNRAIYGAAIKLCDSSVLFLKKHTHIMFQDNHASVAGGAIYASDQCLQVSPPCFFQPLTNSTYASQLGNEISLEFVNNTAKIAGSAIYGGSIDACFTHKKYSVNGTDKPDYYKSLPVYRAIFKFSDTSSDVSRVTSDPYGICVCDPQTNETDCSSRIAPQIEMFPGEWFDIFVSAVGQTNGSVPALISFRPNENDAIVSRSYIHFHQRDPCQRLHLAILSRRTDNIVTLVVGVHQSNPVYERSIYYKLPKLKVTVLLLPCPWVFQLNETNGCDCHELLTNVSADVECDISYKTITKRPQNVWINCDTDNSSNSSSSDQACDRIEVSDKCLEHCSNETDLNSSNLKDQCSPWRRGRLCGSCEDGYTLSFGKPECLDDDSYCSLWKTFIFLFIFLFAGLLFVFFLAIFNFTVSEGTVNGLLFYANFVHANRKCFFPGEALNVDLFRIFINWLNLDFGFEVCFYAGMDAYQKIWWEFGFLFYLLLLGLLIIYSSHRFIRVTRLVGRNVVSVLSTIILFSYPKLVSTSVKVLEPSTVKVFDHGHKMGE